VSDYAFYHLLTKRLDEALPELLEKAVARGMRTVVLAGSKARVDSLDILLWTYRREGFLAHGTRETGHPEAQPIYLTETEENPNQAEALFAVDGVRAEFAGRFARCFDLFDGNDESAVASARERWREAKVAGHQLTYWQQTDRGGWEKKAEA
jgi:DNA polymerase-3 subunit chi